MRFLENPGDFIPEPGKRYGLLSYRGQEKDGFMGLHPWDEIRILSPGSGRVVEAGVRFFSTLRELDRLFLDEIIAEPVPDRDVGKAMLDKLRKASYRG